MSLEFECRDLYSREADTSFKIVKFTIYCTLRCPHFDWAVSGGLVWQVRSGFERLAHRIGKSDSSCGV